MDVLCAILTNYKVSHFFYNFLYFQCSAAQIKHTKETKFFMMNALGVTESVDYEGLRWD